MNDRTSTLASCCRRKTGVFESYAIPVRSGPVKQQVREMSDPAPVGACQRPLLFCGGWSSMCVLDGLSGVWRSVSGVERTCGCCRLTAGHGSASSGRVGRPPGEAWVKGTRGQAPTRPGRCHTWGFRDTPEWGVGWIPGTGGQGVSPRPPGAESVTPVVVTRSLVGSVPRRWPVVGFTPESMSSDLKAAVRI